MKRITVVTVFCLISSPLHGQWVKTPTAGIPRTVDGQPTMTAPAPKDRNGRPDLSGLWGAEKTRPCPPNGCDDMQISEQFLDIGWRVPRSTLGGLLRSCPPESACGRFLLLYITTQYAPPS